MRITKLVTALLALALLALVAAGPAAAKDRNRDRIPDRWEKKHRLSLKVKQGRRDQDRDGLRNRAEFKAKSDPRDADSDDDGVDDGDEGAGLIASYDPGSGLLVINLFGGKSVEGLVTAETEIRCGCRGDHAESPDDDASSESRLHGGGNSGPGGGDEAESGDDDDSNSGPGNDDHDNSGPGKGGGHGRSCSTDELVEGAVVSEAELELTGGGLVFEEIELVKNNPDGV